MKPGDEFPKPHRNDVSIDDELSDRRRRGLLRTRRRAASAAGPRVRIDGRELLNFSSNDYLNLANEPRLKRAAVKALREFGCGSGAAPLVSGWLTPQRRLESALARWHGAEAALTFSSGFLANVAVLSAFSGRQDALFSDALNHASLIDGCRLGRGRTHVYRHNDVDHLEALLRRHSPGTRRRGIVTDTVFSMDGDLCRLAELRDLAARFDAHLIIDEAHATGVLGPRGTGLAGTLSDLNPDRLIKVGTLSKALGCQGGFVVGTKRLIRWLLNVARPYVYSTGMSPPVAAAARRAVRIAEQADDRRRHLGRLGELLRNSLADLNYQLDADPPAGSDVPEPRQRDGNGFEGRPPQAPPYQGGVGGVATREEQVDQEDRREPPVSPIIPLIVGDNRAALAASERLLARGLLVPAIRPPTVPEGTARLRVSLGSGHTEDDIRTLTDALREASTSDQI